ncbi:hypothetical protein [Pseudobythopirellula maris]|uniref:hypothetical protein n=1 Tax=Pseudobythopirellula maris TaxID=2527991 RepID=UPI0011B6A906|nr:hypothetical protein [Pseudobythopirellula maris]
MTLLLLAAPRAAAQQYVYATSYFGVAEEDEDPTLHGVMRIDLSTGIASTFVPEGAAGMSFPNDIAVGPHDGNLYVAAGRNILRFSGVDGSPMGAAGNDPGVFARFSFLNGPQSLLFEEDGTLYASTLTGGVATFDPMGDRGASLANGLVLPGGMAFAPGGGIAVDVGNFSTFGDGGVELIKDGQVTTLVTRDQDPEEFNGATSLAYTRAPGDYDGDGTVTSADHDVWVDAFGTNDPAADGNGDGVVDAADFTVWRDHLGETARLLATDFLGNKIVSFALDGSDLTEWAVTPPEIPDPLPDGVDEQYASNFPSGMTVTDGGTVLVSTMGLTRRPDNRGAILEYDFDGNLLRVVADGLPAMTSIALALPATPPALAAVPEPHALALGVLSLMAIRLRRSNRPTRRESAF